MTEPEPPRADEGGAELDRVLGAWDATLLTIGAVVGTGIFLTAGDVARALPHPGLIVLVWIAAGVLTLAGALTYAELGVMFPHAGGIYHFLKEAYGPLWGFLYGWTAFLVINSGGIAAIAVGFGEYLGTFIPFFSGDRVLASAAIGPWTWTLSGAQGAAVLAIAVLTAVNHFGLREGALTQDLLTLARVALLGVLIVAGLTAPAAQPPALLAPLPATASFAGLGLALIAAFWTFDGWYGATLSAGELRRPERTLPIGLTVGTAAVAVLYVLVNLVYIRAMPVATLGQTSRIGEAAAAALLGPVAGRAVALLVVLATFGCLASTILYTSRLYLPMARDGLFFRSVGRVHPRHRTPVASLWAQSGWSALLTISGTYSQLYTYAIFAGLLFHVGTTASVFVLRRTRPAAPRPYRTWGYPVTPAVFALASLALVANTLHERPVESLIGLGLVALGLPAYLHWNARPAGGRAPEDSLR
jgi:APA family basic amino acid/polyamine antiporter